MSAIDFAVIGGTGLYALDELVEVETLNFDTRFGPPSGPITMGRWQHLRVAFLARHGENHSIAPHRVNYRANLAALMAAGAQRIISVNAVGGITLGPQALAVCDQMIDYTHGRFSSFSDFEGEKVDHIDFSDPYTESVRQQLLAAAQKSNLRVHASGCYGCTQGPRLETKAEVARLKRDGCDVIGMTGMPEAALAREAKLDYASLSVVANWAAGCGDAGEITLEEIFANLKIGMQNVRQILLAL